AGVPVSSFVTSMSRKGTTFGIRLAGSPEWFTAEAPKVGHALYHPGRGPDDGARDIGDSAVLELCGLGAAAAAGSPAVAQLLGGSMAAAAALTERLATVCAGQSSRVKIPVLGDLGPPLAGGRRRQGAPPGHPARGDHGHPARRRWAAPGGRGRGRGAAGLFRRRAHRPRPPAGWHSGRRLSGPLTQCPLAPILRLRTNGQD